MVAIIWGVEFEVENRAEALAAAVVLDSSPLVTVRYWHPIRKKVREEHYLLVDGQWFGYQPHLEQWIAVEEDGRVIHPKITRTDLPTPGAA